MRTHDFAWREEIDLADEVARLKEELNGEGFRRAEAIVRRYEREYRKKAAWRKWFGVGISLLGLTTALSSCPFYAVALIGPETVVAGLALLIVGGVLIFLRPKMKDTNRALIAALKHGNILTVPRLALEMDLTVEKAEKTLQELMKKGIAEIDLDHKGPDDALVYRIKGL